MYQRSGSSAPQKRAKPPIAEQRKADARKAEGRIAEDGGEAQAGRELARQELQQASERKIGDDQKACGGSHQHGVAAKGNAVEPMNDAGVDDHHHHEDGEERRQLSNERRERAAAGRSAARLAGCAVRTRSRPHIRRRLR